MLKVKMLCGPWQRSGVMIPLLRREETMSGDQKEVEGQHSIAQRPVS